MYDTRMPQSQMTEGQAVSVESDFTNCGSERAFVVQCQRIYRYNQGR